MCKICCRTCHYWGPRCFFNIDTKKALAYCRDRLGSFYNSLSEATDHSDCDGWSLRQGEPLGTGVTRLWFSRNSWMDEASIIHDMRYDRLPSYMTPYERDLEWYENTKILANGNIFKLAECTIGFGVIRAYAITHGEG